MYLCYYCTLTADDWEEIILHLSNSHNNLELKFKSKILCENSGKIQIISKSYGFIPHNTNFELNKEEETVKILKDEICHESYTENTSCDDEVDIGQEHQDVVDILADALKELKIAGHSSALVNFLKLVAQKKFPLQNIAFLLFCDVISWYSCDNTVLMRYQQVTKMFWRIGEKYFHEKFLLFMGGFKSNGCVINNNSTQGCYPPMNPKLILQYLVGMYFDK